jgi:hypothetical protein
LPEKIHTTHSTLPDILLSPLALHIDLARAGRAPRAPRVPGDWNAAPTYRRSRVAEKDSLRRRDTPLSPPVLSAPSPAAVLFLAATAVSPCLKTERKKIPLRIITP